MADDSASVVPVFITPVLLCCAASLLVPKLSQVVVNDLVTRVNRCGKALDSHHADQCRGEQGVRGRRMGCS